MGGVILELEDEGLLEHEDGSGAKRRTTHNEMELTAAIEVLRYLKGASRPITLTSGSRYLIDGMNEWIDDWRRSGWRKADGKRVANRELWESLLAAAADLNVTWKWLPGSASTPENERASLLAKLAANSLSI